MVLMNKQHFWNNLGKPKFRSLKKAKVIIVLYLTKDQVHEITE